MDGCAENTVWGCVRVDPLDELDQNLVACNVIINKKNHK